MGRRFVNFHRVFLRQSKLGAGMEFADARGLAASDDDAAPIHDIHVERNDAHRACDNFLRQFCFNAEHLRLA